VTRAGVGEFAEMLSCPRSRGFDGFDQATTERGELVLHAGRVLVELGTQNQPVAVHGRQGFGQNLRADRPERTLEFRETTRTVLEAADDRRRPLVADEQLFPTDLRPFAEAHARVVPTLRTHAEQLDWLVLSPPAGLTRTPTPAVTYRLIEPPVSSADITGTLGYNTLARAIADEATRPSMHHTQALVLTDEPTAHGGTSTR
jgi:hypothetical protein